jgi:hypothetical protein
MANKEMIPGPKLGSWCTVIIPRTVTPPGNTHGTTGNIWTLSCRRGPLHGCYLIVSFLLRVPSPCRFYRSGFQLAIYYPRIPLTHSAPALRFGILDNTVVRRPTSVARLIYLIAVSVHGKGSLLQVVNRFSPSLPCPYVLQSGLALRPEATCFLCAHMLLLLLFRLDLSLLLHHHRHHHCRPKVSKLTLTDKFVSQGNTTRASSYPLLPLYKSNLSV